MGSVAGWMRLWRLCVVALAVLAAMLCAAAAQQERALRGVALVIGQSAYRELPGLPNPANDARAIAQRLSELGFNVDTALDADAKRLDRALVRFEEDAADADVALLYYSGHGIEADGENYIAPVDARMPGAQDAARDLVAVAPILERLRARVPIVIALLDACRTNPFPPGTVIATADGAVASVAAAGLGVPRGAIALKDDGGKTLGTLLGFAAEPGKAALDGEPGSNSPYAAALLKHLGAGGYAFGDVMTMVAEEVYLKTSARQLPWTNASLRRLLYFGLTPPMGSDDDEAISDGRRRLLLTIAATPPQTRQLVQQVAATNDVPLDALYGMLDALGVDAAHGTVGERLSQGAERLKAMLAERHLQTRQDVEIVRLSALADRAETEGVMALALQFRDRASARADAIDAALDEAERNIAGRRLELAATYRANADTANLNFDFATAARRYADAFAQAERWDVQLAYTMKVSEGDAWADLGGYRGDMDALKRSLDAYGQALEIGRQLPNARRDAALKGNMAIVLTKLGTRSADGAAWLDQAAALYDEIAKALPRKRYPEDWAYTQLNLGGLYQSLADMTGDARYLDKALKGYSGAADVMTRKAAPKVWAGLQVNMANAYAARAKRDGGVKDLQRAAKALEAALSIWTRDADPLEWALATTNLGSVLGNLGVKQKDAATLRRAIVMTQAAIEVTTRDRQPLDWAGAMINIGSTYLDIADLEDDTGLCEAALASYRAAREVATRGADIALFAATWQGEGRALLLLGRRQNSMDRLREAEVAAGVVVETMAGGPNRIGWARARSLLGEVLLEIGRHNGDGDTLRRARAAFEEARSAYREGGMGEANQGFWEKQIAAVDTELAK